MNRPLGRHEILLEIMFVAVTELHWHLSGDEKSQTSSRPISSKHIFITRRLLNSTSRVCQSSVPEFPFTEVAPVLLLGPHWNAHFNLEIFSIKGFPCAV